MPQFILDHGGPDGTRILTSLDEFAQGYVEAMFFTNTGSRDDEDLEDGTVADLAPETVEKIIRDCERFQKENAELLEQAYGKVVDGLAYTPERAGHDFWFTRNGHGVGFWCRQGLDDLGDQLSAVCGWRTSFREVDLYRGDDGRIYLGG
jgi:hypothetical protein